MVGNWNLKFMIDFEYAHKLPYRYGKNRSFLDSSIRGELASSELYITKKNLKFLEKSFLNWHDPAKAS